MWQVLVALLSATLSGTVVSPAVHARAAATTAELTVETSTGSVTSVLLPSSATLECDDDANSTGFLRHVARPACALVRHGTIAQIAKRHRTARLCTDVYGGPQRAHIRGTVGGRHLDVTINRSDGCGIDEWNQLRPLLGDPERRGAIPRRAVSVTTTSTPQVTYHVQRGDTLTQIAKQFHTTVAAIAATNHLTDPDNLTDGQALVMPPPSAVRIEAKLVHGRTDEGFRLTLVGASPSERVTFVITLPDGTTHTGSPHTASPAGVVTSTYTADIRTGTYAVTATGDHGTNAAASFRTDLPG